MIERIYLAGRIETNGWRDSIVGGSRGNSIEHLGDRWPELREAIGPHSYTGPFFVSCDHGCYHGPRQHGVGASGDGNCSGEAIDDTSARRHAVQLLCKDAIARSSLVFAWLVDEQAFGTLVEIGLAVGMRVPTFVGSPRPLGEMWFAGSASYGTVRADTPLEGLQMALEARRSRSHTVWRVK